MKLRYSALSDVGQVRKHNEDAYLADDRLGLFVVCDGVGGRSCGEVASRESARMIWEWVQRESARFREQDLSDNPQAVAQLRHVMRCAIQNACYLVHSLGELDPSQKGMSTTASAVLIVGSIAIIGQVGDSRVYLSRGDEVVQVTEDHTLINFQLKHGLITPEQAETSRAKNVITRAVGHHDYVEVDVHSLELQAKDRLLLCSDGLYSYFENLDEVVNIMVQDDTEAAIVHAIDMANKRGGSDNITAMLVECEQLAA